MNYELGSFIASGSFGKVYELIGKKKKDKKKVVKFIPLTSYGINNYLEPYITINLKHKNILNSLDVVLEKRQLKIIYYKADCDLRKLIGKIKNYKNVLFQLAEGINFLHSKNILHGDIKPENILKFNNTYKLTDFGYAKILNHNYIDVTLYTKLYRPPEIYSNRCYLKSDMWALGCTFYEIITGNNLLLRTGEDMVKINKIDKKNILFTLIELMTTHNIKTRLNYKQLCIFFGAEHEENKDIKFDFDKIYRKYNIEKKDKFILRKKIYGKNKEIRINSNYAEIEEKICLNKFNFDLL